jgi:uncharacterized membrane protein
VSVIVAALAIGWLVLLIAAPWLPPMVAAVFYAAGAFICHQRPDRSFHLDAAQLPVCARCLGVYAGAASGSIIAHAPGLVLRLRPRTLLVMGLVPTLVTLVVEWSDLADPGNVVRGAAGVPIGLAAALVLVPRLRVH